MRQTALLLVAIALAGCPGDATDAPADDSDTEVADSEPTDSEPVETDTDVVPTCSGEDLCTRSIDACGVELTMDACLSFYDPATTTCADIAAYEACNCDCIGASTCDDYFGCGEICFQDHCAVSLR